MTRTTGFASPAADYAHERLVLCDDKESDPLFTFFFRIDTGVDHSQFAPGDILAISRMAEPQTGQMCVGIQDKEFVVYEYGQVVNSHWGVITEIMSGI